MEENEENVLSEAEQFRNRVILKTARIEKVEQHPGGSLLYILTLNDGDEEPRQIVSSIVPFYKPEELLGKTIVIVYNLKPANFRGVRSNGMLLAASDAVETEIDGKKIGADGKFVEAKVYKNGSVG